MHLQQPELHEPPGPGAGDPQLPGQERRARAALLRARRVHPGGRRGVPGRPGVREVLRGAAAGKMQGSQANVAHVNHQLNIR